MWTVNNSKCLVQQSEYTTDTQSGFSKHKTIIKSCTRFRFCDKNKQPMQSKKNSRVKQTTRFKSQLHRWNESHWLPSDKGEDTCLWVFFKQGNWVKEVYTQSLAFWHPPCLENWCRKSMFKVCGWGQTVWLMGNESRITNVATIWRITNAATIWRIKNAATIWRIMNVATIWWITNVATIWWITNVATIWRITNAATIWSITNAATIGRITNVAIVVWIMNVVQDNHMNHECRDNLMNHKYSVNCQNHECRDNLMNQECSNNLMNHECRDNHINHEYHENLTNHECSNTRLNHICSDKSYESRM